MAKRTGTAGFFRNVTDGLQTNALSFPLGGLKNSIFFQNFSHICIFNLDQQKISSMKVGSYPDMPGAVNYPQACFKCIFQKIGKNQTHIYFVNRESGRQIKPQRKWNVFPSGKCIVVPCYTVCSLIFTQMHIKIGDFADGAGKIFFEFWKILFFCQSGNLVQVVAHIMPCLSHFFNGSF